VSASSAIEVERPSDAPIRLGPVLRTYGVWFALAALIVFGVVAVDHFATAQNTANVLSLAAPLGVIALGQTFVIMVGGLDLSVGALASLTGVLSVGLITSDGQLPLILALTLLIGIAVGSFNGATIVATRIDPMILTFGMLSVLLGCTYLYTEASVGKAPQLLIDMKEMTIAGVIPLTAIVLVMLTVLAWFVLTQTPFGRYVKAVGSDEAAARRSGVPTGKVKIAAYGISGLTGAIGGILLAARLETGYPLAGAGLELDAIVAVMLGGTPFGGGRGSAAGTLGGVFVLAVLTNIQNLLGVTPSAQQVVNGTVIVLAIALYAARRFRG
jgi:ribose/xylose/arabinose/galactoside ABC-type transport system permease subunit